MSALFCRQLRLRQFRNFAALDLTFPPAGVALIGSNGSGKTNLLEALYYLEIFRSFRGAPDEQLVRFGADAFHVDGRFEENGSGHTRAITAAYEPRSHRKRVTVEGVVPERLSEALGQVGAVIFSPSDMAIVAGAPAERRRFLDIVLSLNVTAYLDALQRYRQVLRQRNAVLKRGDPAAALAAWDEGLIKWGSRVAAVRARWILESAPSFEDFFAEIGGGTAARLVYRPALPLNAGEVTTEHAAESFRAALDRVRVRERERRLTLAGPHRDDMSMLIDGPDGLIDLRDYGSGGQLRTAAVALRMVEADTIRASRARPPIVLLDDVFAELDHGRARRILDLLEARERSQVLLTAPKETDLGLGTTASSFTSTLTPWRIEAGKVTT